MAQDRSEAGIVTPPFYGLTGMKFASLSTLPLCRPEAPDGTSSRRRAGPIEQARAERRRQTTATEAAALRRARTERAAREAGTTTIVR